MRGRRLRPRNAVAAGLVVVLAGGGWAAYAGTADAKGNYRTATVALGDVDQTLSLSGTLHPSGSIDLAFGTSGTVAAVPVSVGDEVTAGQVLARLDTESLKTAVEKARAELASARAQLESDEDAQTAAASETDSSSSSAPTQQQAPQQQTQQQAQQQTQTTPSGSSSQALVAQIRALQTKVEGAQTALGTAEGELTTATARLDDASAALGHVIDAVKKVAGDLSGDGDLATALDRAEQDCAANDDGTEADAAACASDLSDAVSALTGARGDMPGTGDSELGAALQAVSDAKSAVASAKTDVEAARTGLDDYSTQLDALLTRASTGSTGSTGSDTGGTGASTGPSTGSSTGSKSTGKTSATSSTDTSASSAAASTSAGSPAGLGGAGGAQTVTAATLASDQAEIDEAKVSLIEANQALAGALIRAPRAGTVASVDVAKGDSASSGTDVITVVAEGTTTVELSVSLSNLQKLEVGQTAEVTPAGAVEPEPAKVTSLGRVADSSSGSSTYPVVVTLDDSGLDLPSGGSASVEVVVGTATDVLTVPTSAVSNSTVTVLGADGTTGRARVTTGATSSTLTEITEGLEKGQKVVLADLDRALPTGDTGSQRGFGGLGGGLGGGFGGGPPGGVRTFTRG